jgi:hypothetical protein
MVTWFLPKKGGSIMCFQMSQKALIKENDSLPQVPWASNPRQSKPESKDPQVSDHFYCRTI